MQSRWFITTPFAALHDPAGELKLPSDAIAHAKRMGTDRSACGLRTDTWQRLWEWEFPDARVRNCEHCRSVVAHMMTASV